MDLTWRNSLEDSIAALRSAANEYRAALQLARAGQWTVNLDRIRLADGRVSATGKGSSLIASRPHDSAICRINDLYRSLTADLMDGYEQAALLYADGATWAAQQVIDGHTPELVEVHHDHIGQPITGSRPRLDEHLAGWSGREQYLTAKAALIRCENARDAADELAERGYLADHEASDMHEAFDVAAGLADAAYAYGLQAEAAVQYAINALLRGRR